MEPFLIVVLVAAAAVALFLWTRRRANPPPAPGEPSRNTPTPEQQVLDRNTVLGRTRAFDPTNWDDTPDGSEEDGADTPEDGPVDGPVGEDLPRFFDYVIRVAMRYGPLRPLVRLVEPLSGMAVRAGSPF